MMSENNFKTTLIVVYPVGATKFFEEFLVILSFIAQIQLKHL